MSTSPDPAADKAAKTAKKEAPPEPTLGVWEVFTTSAEAVPVAGMLEDDSSLHDASLTEDEWKAKLDAYLKSPRP